MNEKCLFEKPQYKYKEDIETIKAGFIYIYDMAFILFLSSAVRWPAKAGSAYVILDTIRPTNRSRNT